MNHLIIIAHPNPESFNFAIANQIQQSAAQHSTEIIIRDLYRLNFNPVLSPDDLKNSFSGNYNPDIVAEQNLIKQADFLHFIAPLWWNGFPAMMKGYFDKIFAKGFAYSYDNGKHNKLLANKKAILYTTAGASDHAVEEYEIAQTLKRVRNEGIFDFVGIQVVQNFFFAGVTTKTPDQRKQMLLHIDDFIQKLSLNETGMAQQII